MSIIYLSMINRGTIFALFLVIILEGYVVLSSELIAIRLSIPFVGSGTETVSIIIAAVLMPLAFGYYYGGRFKPKPGYSVRRKLITNIVVSMIFLLPGLSYLWLQEMHRFLMVNGLHERLMHIALYSLIFLVTPVFLLGQTIPLISNYFGKERLSRITGRILFFSTLGSFAGAIVTTMVFMSTIGVNNTVSLNMGVLALLAFVLSKRKISFSTVSALLIVVASLVLNSDFAQKKHDDILEHNLYNSIAIKNIRGTNHLFLNNNASSKYDYNGNKYRYIEFAERVGLMSIFDAPEPKNILVVGAGAFTFGYDDNFHHYDYVDIDKSLKDVAEEHILPDKIGENKVFHAMPARAFLTKTEKKYDLVLLDVYFGKNTFPDHLITQDFFRVVKAHLNKPSIVVMNFITSPYFKDRFSQNLDATVRSVFPFISRQIMWTGSERWHNDLNYGRNGIYVYRHDDYDAPEIYTDNKNRAFLDKE